MVWSAKVVEKDGTVLSTLADFSVTTITKELNGADTASFYMPKGEATTADVVLLEREVQIFDDADLIHWGVPVSRNASGSAGQVDFASKGLWWYFTRRNFGTADRTNEILNSDFDTGTLANWTAVNLTDADAQTLNVLTGTYSARLEAAAAGGDTYLRQRFNHTDEWHPFNVFSVVGWVFIADGPWIGPAAFTLGLYVHWEIGGEIIYQHMTPIDAGTARDEWVRLNTSIRVAPPDTAGVIEVRLYCPGGVVYWDGVQAVRNDTTGSGSAGTDIATLAATVITYAQNGTGKSDLLIDTDTPVTGEIYQGGWRHYQHERIDTAIETLARREDGFDFDIVVSDSPVLRRFTTFHPMKGADLSATVIFTIEPGDHQVADYTLGEDGTECATSIIVQGEADGPTKEEGGAIDYLALDGLVLELVTTAPNETPITELDGLAREELTFAKQIVQTLEVVLPNWSTAYKALLQTGMLVGVDIADGAIEVNDTYRVVGYTIDCVADSVTVTLNRWIET